MQRNSSKLAITLAVLLSLNMIAKAEPVVTEIMSVHDDRIYFPVGREAHVYAGAAYILLSQTDTVCGGYIEHAWDGVAISQPIMDQLDSVPIEDLTAIIQSADLDSVSVISLGTDIARLQVVSDSSLRTRAELISYDDLNLMEDDFYAGLLDGIVSFHDLTPRPANVTTTGYPAPYLAAMVPNIGRECNNQGQLTTSLYYRFDFDHLELSFDGDRARMTHRFESKPKAPVVPAGRIYAYDPERGRRLFETINNRPELLSFYAGDPALAGLSHYFADILSRDHCRVIGTDNNAQADVRFEFIPVSSRLPSMTIYALYYHLLIDSLPGSLAAEKVRQIAAELRFVESPRLPEDYYRHLDLAGRIMTEELGLFPLFQPTMFLHVHEGLHRITVDADGKLDFTRAVLVQPPLPLPLSPTRPTGEATP